MEAMHHFGPQDHSTLWQIARDVTSPPAPGPTIDCARLRPPKIPLLVPAGSFAMVETRSTARRRAATAEAEAEACRVTLPKLADELIVNCMSFLPLTDIARLGRTCKSMQAASKTGSLWRDIKFLPMLTALNMTDERLEALLERVDARANTVSISLENCIRVNGSGLAPLSDSLVLESLDLRRAADHKAETICQFDLSPDLMPTLQMLLRSSKLKSLLVHTWDIPACMIFLEGVRPSCVAYEERDDSQKCKDCVDLLQPERDIARLFECPSCNGSMCWSCAERMDECEGCGDHFCTDCLAYSEDQECTMCQNCLEEYDGEGTCS